MKKESAKEMTWDEIGKAIGMKIEKGTKEGGCMPWRIKDHVHNHGSNGAFYGFGFLGSCVYFISTATGFWMGVLGVLKAMVWPAFLVYGALKFFGM